LFEIGRRMDIDIKLAVLEQIYAAYDDFAANLDVACQRYCAQCCTCNVTLTTLEGYRIVEDMISSGQSHLLENLQGLLKSKRFQPQLTINGLAELCMQAKEPPEELSDPVWGPCALLKDDDCPVYPVRPFGCRCMVSKQNCKETGYADMDPLVLTVNNVYLQYIEHIDANGFTGNLADILSFLAVKASRCEYGKDNLKSPPDRLIGNRPIKVLMIPPEHRLQLKPVLSRLNSIKIP
jgi:Fe-S-cluster containining protein